MGAPFQNRRTLMSGLYDVQIDKLTARNTKTLEKCAITIKISMNKINNTMVIVLELVILIF